MPYKPENTKIEDFEDGTKAEAVITNIREGLLKHLYKGEIKSDDGSVGIEIEAEGEKDGVPVRATKIFGFRTVKDGKYIAGKKSDLAKFYKKYKAFPAKNMMIELVYKNDYWEVSL